MTRQTKVFHAELWGTRAKKYAELLDNDVSTTGWTELRPQSPFYFFAPREERHRSEYQTGWKITEVMPVNVTGIVTARDEFVIDFDHTTLLERISEFRSESISDEAMRQRYFSGKGSSKYPPGDTRGWKLPLARDRVRKDKHWKDRVVQCLYRPFDLRWIYYTPWMVDWGRPEVMRHMLAGENIAFHLCRQIVSENWQHLLATSGVTDDCYVSNRTRERGYMFPLYLYPDPEKEGDLFANGASRHANLHPDFVKDLEQRLRLSFVPDGTGDLERTFGPEDVFHYIYAVLHSPTYRERYAEFLRIDFPRVPLTSDRGLFAALCTRGKDLVSLHLLESPVVSSFITRYPVRGDDVVQKGHPRYFAPGEPEPGTGNPLKAGRVYISKDAPKGGVKGQYFEGVPPEVWEFHVGGYQVCEKWLKDRRGRKLSYNDLEHYQKIVVALDRTIRLMAEIDEVIPGWPLE